MGFRKDARLEWLATDFDKPEYFYVIWIEQKGRLVELGFRGSYGSEFSITGQLSREIVVTAPGAPQRIIREDKKYPRIISIIKETGRTIVHIALRVRSKLKKQSLKDFTNTKLGEPWKPNE